MLLEWSQPLEVLLLDAGDPVPLQVEFLQVVERSKCHLFNVTDVIGWEVQVLEEVELIHVRDVGEWVIGIVDLIYTFCIIIVS